MTVEMLTLWSSSRSLAPLAVMWTTPRNWGEMSYWGLLKTQCPKCPRFTLTIWKPQVRVSNLWHWRRWLHITGGTLHGDETQTFLGMVKIANCLTSGAADDGREQLEGGAVAQRSQQVSWPWIYASWVENHHRQDARVRRQEHGREDQFRGVREHHWHVGRVGPQEDGGASVIKQQRGIT